LIDSGLSALNAGCQSALENHCSSWYLVSDLTWATYSARSPAQSSQSCSAFVPPQVEGNVPNLSWPSTGTADGVMVGVIGVGVCPGASEDDAARLQPPAKAARAAASAAAKAAALAAALAAATPRTRSFPAPMEPRTYPPPPPWPPPATGHDS
jgi:hypothetical protein